jgi:hypothetical protein
MGGFCGAVQSLPFGHVLFPELKIKTPNWNPSTRATNVDAWVVNLRTKKAHARSLCQFFKLLLTEAVSQLRILLFPRAQNSEV